MDEKPTYAVEENLREHEQHEMRAIEEIKELIKHKEEGSVIMETPSIENVFKPGNGNGMDGMGLGGGALGLVALLSLLNRNGLGNGNWNDGNGAGAGAVNQITLGQIQGTLGDIKASVPLAEAQVQLALAGQAQQLMAQMNNNAQSTLSASADTRRDIASANAANIAQFGALAQTVNNGTYQVTSAVRDDGDKTRALITAQNEANLQRMLTVAENALLEQRAVNRSREVEVNVTQSVNQNQNQLQTQAQQQQQFLITNNLLNQLLSQAQIAQATNQSLIIGNSGDVRGGPQTANPTNVRA